MTSLDRFVLNPLYRVQDRSKEVRGFLVRPNHAEVIIDGLASIKTRGYNPIAEVLETTWARHKNGLVLPERQEVALETYWVYQVEGSQVIIGYFPRLKVDKKSQNRSMVDQLYILAGGQRVQRILLADTTSS